MSRLLRRTLPAGLALALVAIGFAVAAPAQAEAAQRIFSCGKPSWVYVPNRYLPTNIGAVTRGCGVEKRVYIISRPSQVQAAYNVGFYWCFAVSQTPTGPYGMAMMYWRAVNYCRDNAWHFVRYA